MDVTTCLKSFLLAIHQYRGNRTAHNTVQLHKQVELLHTHTRLVELAGDPNTSPALTGTIISSLAQLACVDESRVVLQSSYNLTNTLASIIRCHSATPREPLVLQCLQVLQRLTYNARIIHCSNYIHEFIHFLIFSTTVCCCNVKEFYCTLINLCVWVPTDLTVVVFALSILASLTLNEDVGEKLFHAKNIHQTFQLIFNIIVNGDGTLTRKYSVDLLVDLLRNPKIADYQTRYEHFSMCVSQVLGLLHVKDPDSATKVLELLLALCGLSGLRRLLCEVVFCPAIPRLQAAICRLEVGLDAGQKTELGLALIQWLSSPADGEESCCLQALQLLTELLEEALGSEVVSVCVLGFVELLVPRVSSQVCLSQVEILLSCCHNNNPLTDHDCLSQVCGEAVLKTLELMSKLRQQVKDMETSFYRILQDQRMVTPLSLALTSNHKKHVQT
ncbi:unnamed protein product, partial [Coregonus sp. 'balchen']